MKPSRALLSMLLFASATTTSFAQNKPVVQFIATGGTIAMKIDPVKNAPVPAISGDDLLATVPDIGKYATIQVNNLSNVPSDYMDPPRWIALTRAVQASLDRPDVAGVIVSHGTDTLEETAYWLDLTVRSDKPVVLIGAQRNASSPDFDGPRNLLNAARIAVDEQSKGKGVMLAMNNQINAARYVTKTHTANVETFNSGDFGFIGEVYPDRVIYSSTPSRRQHIPIQTDKMPEVEIVAMYGGADGAALRNAVDRGVKGIVVQALGMGNMNQPMFEAVKYALSKKVPVVISTRVHNGRVLPNYGFVGGGKTSFDAGAVMADDLKPAKARILLMLLLQRGVTSQADLQAAFSR
ncbi:asparaginase [Cupriavidus gilardii]|uniref:Asparaginase n=1 Tax=Cupriavidus gilardii TaxID=82541 RepID=A0A6N1BK01_9BURK|nr:asparaginase [Cupriavidus gilardii]ALD92443.1 L-asparaginase [Cupriavidus gilardii CR3]QQE09300.1 asparaginase [Cupriavidus sp. ISTL7]KAB0596487.1 asparaginase [Cupriavidus gilardii]MCT9016558.1 asparaginase [Cupriavidus gilardii]MCT9053019.1 asparaginase [Cupriavidus gilardii]